tara:strand:+ start:190 stop:540 length:351 start_codon:yes stop_codon:yes gene_type:complete
LLKKTAIFFTLFVVVVSLIPLPELPKKIFNLNDKLMHVLVYVIMSGLWIKVGFDEKSLLFNKYIFMVIGIGFFSEILQGILPINRHFEIFDMIANLTGIIMSLSLGYGLYYKNNSN